MKKRGLSVHLVMGADGALTQHGDLATGHPLAREALRSGPSFGVEVVNPYYRATSSRACRGTASSKAPWAHRGEYVLPTPAQAERSPRWCAGRRRARADIRGARDVWPGLKDGRFALGLVPAAAKAPLPGVLAHQYFGHADGSMLVLYAWLLRLEAGLAPDVAFEETVKRTTGGVRADVRDLLPRPWPDRRGRRRMDTFTSVATWLQATGPYGLVAVLGWAFWRVNEKKDAQLRELFDKGGRDGARADRGRDQGRGRSRRAGTPSRTCTTRRA